MSLDLELNAELAKMNSENSNLVATQLLSMKKRKYYCEYKDCGKNFMQQSKLWVHSNSHLNVKPFRCTYEGCGKEFVSKWNMKTHFKLHCQFKSYKCYLPNCQAAYYYSFSLRKHLVKHGFSSKCFTCAICKTKFPRYQTLINHIKTHEDYQIFLVKKERPAEVSKITKVTKTKSNHSSQFEYSSEATIYRHLTLGNKRRIEVESASVENKLINDILLNDVKSGFEIMKDLSLASMNSYTCALQPLLDLVQNLMSY